jgi:hypothetical protein
LVVSAETKIKCPSIKAKGKAHVLWEEDYGLYLDETYRAKYEFFQLSSVYCRKGMVKYLNLFS